VLPQTPDPRASDYFKNAWAAFEQAEHSCGGRITRQYQIGGHAVQLNFAGPALVPLISPAFEHLKSEIDPAVGLRVLLWDSESTGIDMPLPPWDVEEPVRKGENWRFSDQRFRITYSPGNSTFDLLDMDQNLAIHQVGTTSRMPQYESGAPLLQILEWWFDRQEEYILHAGGVGRAEGGVLLVGKGGSGKSTAALACLDSELLYLSDDYCLLTNSDSPTVSSLYNSAKVKASEIKKFPFLKKALNTHIFPDSDKALYFIANYQASKLLPGFPVRAVLIPQVSGSPNTELCEASPAQALLALAPSTIFHFPGTENRAIRKMSRLVKQVPCYILKSGTDLSTIADMISRILG
jgi:hypothetical protein